MSMKTFLPQNQFISNFTVSPRAVRSAAASSDLQPWAAAAPIPCVGVGGHANDTTGRHGVQVRIDPGAQDYEPTSSTGGHQEAPASAPPKNPDAGVLDMTDCISEIFFYARKLMKQPPRFVLNERQFMAEVEEVPLFLREDGYLQRREA
jgi:hypothetical protein